MWLDAFGGDPSAVGRTARLGGTPCEIVGIMPAGFVFPAATAQLWRNVIVDPANSLVERAPESRLAAVGRLAPGVTLAEAEVELRTLMANWRETYDHYEGHFIILRPYLDEIVGDVRPALTMLLGAAGLVLLVICANLASLLLARGEGRRRELAVHFALGAGRGRLVAQLLTESALLALAGGALGVTAAMAFLDGLLSFYPGTLPRAEAIALDWRALAFAAAVTGLTVLLFGLLPALRASSSSPADRAARADARRRRRPVAPDACVRRGRSRVERDARRLRRSAAAQLREHSLRRSRAQRRGRLHGRAGAAGVDVSGPAGRVQLLRVARSRDSPRCRAWNRRARSRTCRSAAVPAG